MRLLSILTALAVVLILFFLVFQRDELLQFAGAAPAPAETVSDIAETAAEAMSDDMPSVSVVAMKSEARSVDGAVILRGRTEAIRQVDVRAETTGRVISTPLRLWVGTCVHHTHHIHQAYYS